MCGGAGAGKGIQDDVVVRGDGLEQATQHALVLGILERFLWQDPHQRLVRGAAILIEDAGEHLMVGLVQVAFEVGYTGFVVAEVDSACRNGLAHTLLFWKAPATQRYLYGLTGFGMHHLVGWPSTPRPRHVAREIRALGVDPVVMAVRPRLVFLVERCEPRLEIVGCRLEISLALIDELRGLALYLVRAFLEHAPPIAVGAQRFQAAGVAEHIVVTD